MDLREKPKPLLVICFGNYKCQTQSSCCDASEFLAKTVYLENFLQRLFSWKISCKDCLLGKGGIRPLMVEWRHTDVLDIAANVDHLIRTFRLEFLQESICTPLSVCLFVHIQKWQKSICTPWPCWASQGGAWRGDGGSWWTGGKASFPRAVVCWQLLASRFIIRNSFNIPVSYLHAVCKKLWLVLNVLLQRVNLYIPGRELYFHKSEKWTNGVKFFFSRRCKWDSPVLFIPICETFHLEERKTINLIKAAQTEIFEFEFLSW